jgi:hypothetical protein
LWHGNLHDACSYILRLQTYMVSNKKTKKVRQSEKLRKLRELRKLRKLL